MEFLVIGCDGAYPSANGACSGYLVTDGASSILLDCGSGVLGKLMAVMDPASLDCVVVSHWHADHASDLLTLRYYLLSSKRKLALFAPGQEDPLRQLCVCPEFELEDIGAGFSRGGFDVTAIETRHPVPCCAIKISRGSRSIVYTGDTNSFPGLKEFCRGTDLLVCDAALTDAQWDEGQFHLSASKAAELALEAGVKRLLLTHFPPYNDPAELLAQGRALYPACMAACAGARVVL